MKPLGGRLARLEALRDSIQSDLTRKQVEVAELSAKVEKLSKVEELFKALMDRMVVDQVRSIEEIVTEGLQSIFFDQNLHFEAEVSPKYGKISIDFFIRDGEKDSPTVIRGQPLEAFGGGPTSVADLILRILAVLRLRKYPLLLLDETLKAVSEEYTDTAGRFLTALSTKMAVPLLMITHEKSFVEHADVAYLGESVRSDDGTKQLRLRSAT